MNFDVHSRTVGYWTATAFTVAGVAFVVTTPWLSATPFLPFFALVAITARLWGYGPSILSIAISATAIDYYVFIPQRQVSFSTDGLIRVIGFVAVSLVIAGIARERTHAEDRLRASLEEISAASLAQQSALERLRRAQEIGKVAAWELEVSSGIVRWSQNAENVFAGSKLINTMSEFFERVHPDDLTAVLAVKDKIADGPLDLQYRIFDDEGRERWYHTRSRPVESAEGGTPKVIAGATADVTEARNSAKALLNAEKLAAAGRLSATIAHEINNPLEAVMNLVFLAKSDPNISQESRKMLQQAEVELGRTAHIARQNLGFYRDRTVPVRVDLRVLLIELVTIYSTHARRKDIRIEIDGDNLMMVVRAGDVRQAVSNVLLNAIDATPKGGEVKVRLAPTEHGASIVIADSGPGVPSEMRERIFEPFFTTKKDYGTGLGLWVTREMLGACGGDIRLNESAHGAEFELIISEESEIASSVAG